MISQKAIKRKAKDSFRKVMSFAPAPLKRYLTEKEIGRITAFMLPLSELNACEQHPEQRREIIRKHKEKHPKNVADLERRLRNLIAEPRYGCDDARVEALRDEIEYAYFAYGFPPKDFAYFHLDKRDMRTFVSNTERTCVKHTMNDFTQSALADKSKVYRYFKDWYKREAVTLETARDFEKYRAFVQKHPVFVVKIVNSSMGMGVWLQKATDDPQHDFHEIIRHGKVLLEERIEQGGEMVCFNDSSINTVRVSTYLTRDGVLPAYGFIRTGRPGSFVDNAGAGGIFAMIDVEKGLVSANGVDEFGHEYPVHPDSGIPYIGFAFPDWDEALRICREASLVLPEMKYKSFDLAYSKQGWVVVEINPSGELVQQACTETGFKEPLRQIMSRMDLICPYSLR